MQGYLLFTHFSKNLLQSYTSLPSHLQSSPPVQFALSCYNAVKDGQYATFFALFKRASYLPACLLLWHVPRVRSMAVQVMSRGYQRYPLAALCDLLCMDDEARVVDLLTWYGLHADVDRGRCRLSTEGGGVQGSNTRPTMRGCMRTIRRSE